MKTNPRLWACFSCPHTGIWSGQRSLSQDVTSQFRPYLPVPCDAQDNQEYLTPSLYYVMFLSQMALKRALIYFGFRLTKKWKQQISYGIYSFSYIQAVIYKKINSYNVSCFSWHLRIFSPAATWLVQKKKKYFLDLVPFRWNSSSTDINDTHKNIFISI